MRIKTDLWKTLKGLQEPFPNGLDLQIMQAVSACNPDIVAAHYFRRMFVFSSKAIAVAIFLLVLSAPLINHYQRISHVNTYLNEMAWVAINDEGGDDTLVDWVELYN